MIDWFVSKIGVIVVTLIIVSVFFYFIGVQKDFLNESISLIEKENIDFLKDSLCNGCWIELSNGSLIKND